MLNSKKAIKNALAVGSLITLTACTGAEPALVFMGATTGIIMDDKLPTDHIASYVTDKDCNYIRHIDDGGPLCRSADYGKVIERPIYCYPTLGHVNCTERKDPYNNGQAHVK